jgi:hypothetical protein
MIIESIAKLAPYVLDVFNLAALGDENSVAVRS